MNPDQNGTLYLTSPLDRREQAAYVLAVLRRMYGTGNPSIVN